MMAGGMVLLWVLVVAGLVLFALWWTHRRTPVPPASELPTTDHLDSGPPADAAPGPVAGVWRNPQPPRWINTVPTGSVPLDESPPERKP